MGAFEDAWADFIEQVGPQLVEEMTNQSPVRTGTLAASHDYRQGEDGSLEVFSDDPDGPIAAYVIRGTRPHPIEPTGPWPLHFFVDGEEVFTMHVDHPGTDANPFNQAAWEAQRDDVLQKFAETVGKGYALAYLNPWRGRKL